MVRTSSHITHSCSFSKSIIHSPDVSPTSHTESLYIFFGRVDKCQSVSTRITIPTHLRRAHSRSAGYKVDATRNKNNAKRDCVFVVVPIVVARSRTECGVGKSLLLAVICLFHCTLTLPAMLLPSSTTLDSIICQIWISMKKVRIGNWICQICDWMASRLLNINVNQSGEFWQSTVRFSWELCVCVSYEQKKKSCNFGKAILSLLCRQYGLKFIHYAKRILHHFDFQAQCSIPHWLCK